MRQSSQVTLSVVASDISNQLPFNCKPNLACKAYVKEYIQRKYYFGKSNYSVGKKYCKGGCFYSKAIFTKSIKKYKSGIVKLA
jgi:hypothetical protein